MLKQSIENGQTTTYEYDPNGNLESKTTGEETTSYSYDGFNRLTKATLPDGRYQTNKYNALDQRIETMENGTLRQYTYNGRNVIIEKDQAGQSKGTYIRGLDLIAKTNNKAQMSYYLHNRHGDITEIVDGRGKILSKYTYAPFGNLRESLERIDNKYKYAGQQYDQITDQYYLRSRYYAPQIGRFIQEDTFRGDGLNLYAYVANNPLKYVDPSGYAKDGVTDNNQYPRVNDPEDFVEGMDTVEGLEVGLSPIGISEEEIDRKADKAVDELIIFMLINSDGNLYENSVLSEQILDLKILSNWHNLSEIAPNLKKYLTSKSIGQLMSGKLPDIKSMADFLQQEIPDGFSYFCETVNYEIGKEITIKINQIKNLGSFNYLIHQRSPRKKFIRQLDLIFNQYLKMNINEYGNPTNNAILKNRILEKINEVKMINVNYKESRQEYWGLREAIRKETEDEYKEQFKKKYDEYMKKIYGYPLTS